jgi:hypothetical protein
MDNLSTIEQFALAKFPQGQIDGITYEDYFGEIAWVTTPDKSTHAVSTRMMMLETESDRHSREIARIRKQIDKAIRSLR